MSLKRMILCCLMALLLMLPCAALAGKTGSVSGKVHKDSANGEALKGVEVKCDGESDKTDENGKFKIKGIKTGDHTIKFSKSGYESYETKVTIVEGKTANIGDRWLASKSGGDETGSVSGRVHKDSASGDALKGATVECGGKSDKTDENGKYKIKGIKAGDQKIAFSKSDYDSFETTVKIVAGSTANMGDRWLTKKGGGDTGSVSGKLHKDSETGSALGNATVECGGKSDKTDENGKFKIKGINAGDQKIKFSKSGYESYETTVKIVAGSTANVGERWLTETKKKEATFPLPENFRKSSYSGLCAYKTEAGYHTGVDIPTPNAEPEVKAICDGMIVYNTTANPYENNYSKYWNAFVVIKHDCNGDGAFESVAVYGHLISTKTGKVKKGEKIGVIRVAFNKNNTSNPSNNHLHFGYNNNVNKPPKDHWGYVGNVCNDVYNAGWNDPISYYGLK